MQFLSLEKQMSSPELHQLGQVRSGQVPLRLFVVLNTMLGMWWVQTLVYPYCWYRFSIVHCPPQLMRVVFFPGARWLSPINLQSWEVADSNWQARKTDCRDIAHH